MAKEWVGLRRAAAALARPTEQRAVETLISVAPRLRDMGIDNNLRWAHFLGQCSHESMMFRRVEEYLNYRAERLVEVWPSRFGSVSLAAPYANNPEALANKVYGDRRDLGNTQPGDGWRYRGRGFIQLTGRANYTRYGELLGLDLIGNPDLLTRDLASAWLVAGQFFVTRMFRGRTPAQWADLNDVEKVTLAINGGTHGISSRARATEKAWQALRGGVV